MSISGVADRVARISLPRQLKLLPAHAATQIAGIKRSRQTHATAESIVKCQPASRASNASLPYQTDNSVMAAISGSIPAVPAAIAPAPIGIREQVKISGAKKMANVARLSRAHRTWRAHSCRHDLAPNGWSNGRSARRTRNSCRLTILVAAASSEILATTLRMMQVGIAGSAAACWSNRPIGRLHNKGVISTFDWKTPSPIGVGCDNVVPVRNEDARDATIARLPPSIAALIVEDRAACDSRRRRQRLAKQRPAK